MSVAATGWITLAACLVVLGVRMTLAETVWVHARFERRPRRMLRGLDVLTVLLALAAVAAVLGTILPALLAA